MATYKSKHTGERVDDAVTKIPESLPTEDSFIVVKADGSASEYVPRSQVSSDKLEKQTAQTTSDQIYGKLADGSQTMFDLTMGAEPTTIPRRDTAGRVQVADGVSGNDAVNFNQLSAVESSISGLNIQNGEGQYSLIQKVAPSTTTDPNNYAKGKEAVSLGRYDKTYGDRSMTVNYDNENYGRWSFVANTKNKNGSKDVPQENVQSNAMFGCANEIKVGIEGFVAGNSNVNYEGDRFNISGSANENYTNNVRMSGRKNKSLKEIKTPITSGGGDSTNPDTNPTGPTQPYDYTSGTGYADISGTENKVFAMGGRTRGVAGICYSPFGSTEGFWTKAGYLVEDTAKSTETEKYYKPQGLGAKAFGRATHAKEDFTVAGGEQSVALKKGANAIGYYTTANTEWGTVIGKYNVGKTNTLFEVGNGYAVFDAGRKNAFEVLVDGRAKVQTAPVDTDDVVRKLELDAKYDKTGGTIGGNVVITGDLTVNGTQHINNTENLNVENAMIYSNANGATLATNGGIGIKKNATDVYGIVYDPTSDSVKLGIGKSDANGRFTFNANEGQPVAIRDDSSKFTNNNLVKWNSESYKFVDAGKNVENLVDKLPDLLRSQAYVRNANGEDSGLAYTYTDEGNTLALRNASGQLQVSTPSQDNDAANKKFVEDNLVTTPITETETVVVDTTTVNFALDAENDTGMYVSAENAISLGSTQLQWNDGRQKYKVIWDGVEYICYVQATTNPKYKEDGTYTYYDWQILGNGNNKLNCYNKDTNIYPFAITQDRWKNSAEWLIYATTSTAATHTIKVIKVEGTYKKVTPEYQYDYLSMLKNGRNNNTLLHGYSLDDDGLSAGILSGDGNQYVNDVPVGDKYDRHLVIFGDGNRVHRYEATGESHDATIMGIFNELHLKGTGYVTAPSISGAENILTNNTRWLAPFVTGYKNTITANKGSIHPDAVFGGRNKLTYDGNTTYGLNLVGGGSHTIKNAALSLITGLGNTVECLETDKYIRGNIVGGVGNTVNHDQVIVGGRGNTSDRHGQFIAGTYSAANEKAIVKIGNGTKDAHANAFEVLDDNRAKVFGTPTENNDVLRYQDTAVEVETSLMGA